MSRIAKSLVCLGLVITTTSPEAAGVGASPSFVDIDYPGAVWTYAAGLNDAGAVVGQYLDAAGIRHGFLFDGGSYATIDCPSPYTAQSYAGAINNLGQIAGFCAAPGGINGVYGTTRSFVLTGGVLTLLPDIGSYGGASTFAYALNDSGVVAGWYADSCLCTAHGFTWTGGTYATVDAPGSPNTQAYGINNAGDIVGIVQPSFGGGGEHGFILHAGSFTVIDYPGAIATDFSDINDAGQIVGQYRTSSQLGSFLLEAGTFSTIDHPDAQFTEALAVNAAGQTAGEFADLSGRVHGFVTVPAQSYAAAIQPPINASGTSIFNAARGVVPVKFTLNSNGAATCQLPPAAIALVRVTDGTSQTINQSDFLMPADDGSSFRIDSCQYVYNLGTKTLGAGSYEVRIAINGSVVGTASFGLK
jgi:uncharacterized membrane protein